MRKTMSTKQIEANRANARKSTGPRTPEGRAVSKMNALKHGILSREVLVRGVHARESARQFAALHQRFRDDWQPVGVTEEMLVDQIVTAHWRLRRALTAEAGEIALSVDGGQWHRETSRFHRISLAWELEDDPVFGMRDSELGNRFMEEQLKKVMASVEAEGELTEAAIASVVFRGKPYRLTRELENLRRTSQPDAAEVSPEAWREKEKARILTFLRQELTYLSWRRSSCAERERKEEAARQSAAVLPSLETLEKIQRYETRLERQLYRAMAQLERLQRIRRGEAVPAPLSVEVSSRNE